MWIYEHHDNGGSLCVDAAGDTYRFVATPRAEGVGQFRRCDLRTAVWRARLPDVVDRVWYAGPAAGADEPALDDPTSDDPAPADRPAVRRGHLTLVAG